jgi:DNA/RNA endonuclease YhcR with UshA esterase domain
LIGFKTKRRDNVMRNLGALVIAIGIVGFILSAEPFAQPGTKGSRSRMYDPKTVETLSGEVVSVDKIPNTKGRGYGVHMTLKTDKETISVHLGPGWYIEKQEVKIKPGDKVEVTGSRITYEGKPAIVAAEVKKGDDVLKLRDENGFPLWAGGRGR